jgi:hypothetical protein
MRSPLDSPAPSMPRYPLSPSPRTPPLDTTSAVSHSPPASLLPAKDRHESFTVSYATSETTTKAFPPTPGGVQHLALRRTNSLHSLFSAHQRPVVVEARPPTISEAATDFASRGSYVKREEEAKVDELLLETTQTFYPPSTTADAPAIKVSPGAEEREAAKAEIRIGHAGVHLLNQSVQPQCRVRPSFQLESVPRSTAAEWAGASVACDAKLQKVMSIDLLSSSSLRSPTVPPLLQEHQQHPQQQHFVSTVLYPVTPTQSRCTSRPQPSVWSLSGSPTGISVFAPAVFGEEREAPQPLMRFPVFNGLADTLLSQSSRSTYGGGASTQSSGGRSKDDMTTPRESQMPTPPDASSQVCPTHESSNRTGTTADSFSRGQSCGAQGSMLADSPSRFSEGISGVFPPLSSYTSLTATTAAAALSSEEVVAPTRSLSRSQADGGEVSHRHESMSRHRRQQQQQILGIAASVHEVLSDPSFLPLSSGNTNNSSTLAQSAPSVQLSSGVLDHLNCVPPDCRPLLEPPTPRERKRELSMPAFAPAMDSLNSTVTHIAPDALRRKRHSHSLASLLPPLSPQTPNMAVHEVSPLPSARAASAVYLSEPSSTPLLRCNPQPCTTADSLKPHTPLLGRLFREPKTSKHRVWVSTAIGDLSSLSNEK